MTSPTGETEATRFLNVDLDLTIAAGSDELLAALQPAMFILNPEPHPEGFVTLELASTGTETPEKAIEAMIAIVRGLPMAARAEWDRCEKRVFNMGIQAGCTPHSAEFQLSPAALQSMASIGAGFAVTVYCAAVKRDGT